MPEKQPDGTYNATIDDVEYNFQMWGAERAVKTGIQLASIVSGTLKAAGDALKLTAAESADVANKKELEAALMAQVIGSLFASMGERSADSLDVITKLATEGVKRIEEDGKQRNVANFNLAYKGKLAHLRKVVTAAAEVQYADFFDDVGGFLTGA